MGVNCRTSPNLVFDKLSGSENPFVRVFCVSSFLSNRKLSRGSFSTPDSSSAASSACINNAELADHDVSRFQTGPAAAALHFAHDTLTVEEKKILTRDLIHKSSPLRNRQVISHTGYIPSEGRGMECVLTQTPARRSLRSAGLKLSDQLFSANAMF